MTRQISLKQILVTTFAILSLAAALVFASMYWLDRRMYRSGGIAGLAISGVQLAQRLQVDLLAHKRLMLLHGLTGATDKLERANEARREILEDLPKIAISNSSPQAQGNLENVEARIRAYLAEHDRRTAAGESPLRLYENVSPTFDDALEAVSALTNYNARAATDAKNLLERQGDLALLTGSALALFLIGSVGFLIIFLRRFLFRPLVRLDRDITEYGRNGRVPPAGGTGAREVLAIGESFRRMATDLDRQRENRARFVAAVVHDVKTPAASMEMAIDILAEDDRISPADRRRTMDVLKRQVAALRRIVDDLARPSAVETPRFSLARERVDLADLVHGAVGLFRFATNRHEIQVKDPSLKMECDVDPTRVGQVLNNLLSNAIKYSPDGGVIEVRMDVDGKFWTVSVRDRGIGIYPDEQALVFEPYHRTRRGRTSADGSGLGLAICRDIALAHGGDIGLVSRPGEGSEFTLRIPRAQARNAQDELSLH